MNVLPLFLISISMCIITQGKSSLFQTVFDCGCFIPFYVIKLKYYAVNVNWEFLHCEKNKGFLSLSFKINKGMFYTSMGRGNPKIQFIFFQFSIE